MNRRTLLRGLAAGLGASLLGGAPVAAAIGHDSLRIGLTPVFLDDQLAFLERWRAYLERQMERPVAFVQRSSYREITELLLTGGLDCAWLCGYPYVRHRERLQLVVTPLYRGRPQYQSLLIVGERDRRTRELPDLEGRVFAYADPLSNSGWLVPQAQIRLYGKDPAFFFRRSFFAWSHRNVVEAVAVGLADGGAVDSYVWEALEVLHPELTSRTRVVQRSDAFGFPPIVARQDLDALALREFKCVLMAMSETDTGRALLNELFLDAFTSPDQDLYEGIRALMQQAGLS
ncbi:PhnD/SsuA/transferrin family substrate-binding protein [Thioalkalivibrio sulfidiphilus]|uniref:substrate-binding domain-containing protein n=1 Tax=Thioalkalivibrio sulfidiphilus TaxID=1033854 RepID=UPI00036332F6|nr:PhnD/SsuA/transferrin family substrate-binding protein [Thioalkalivibrio sulfidiphilus]